MTRETAVVGGPGVVAAGQALGTRIDLDDLSKRYRVGDVVVTALDAVNLHVDEAAFVVVLGPSSSGKTTLLNMIGRLDLPSKGRVAHRPNAVEATHDVLEQAGLG